MLTDSPPLHHKEARRGSRVPLEDILEERNAFSVDELTERAESILAENMDKPPPQSRNHAEYSSDLTAHWPYYGEALVAIVRRPTYYQKVDVSSHEIAQPSIQLQKLFELQINQGENEFRFDLSITGTEFSNDPTPGSNMISPGELLIIRDDSKDNQCLAVVDHCLLRRTVFNPLTKNTHITSAVPQLLITTQAWVLQISQTRTPAQIRIVHQQVQGPDSFRLTISSEGEVEMFENQHTLQNSDGSPLKTIILTKTYYLNGEYLMSSSSYQGFRRENALIMQPSAHQSIQLLTHLVSSPKLIPVGELPELQDEVFLGSEEILEEIHKIASCLN